MVGFLARSVIAIAVGTLFLLAVMIALGVDLLDENGVKRRTAKTLATSTQRQRNVSWNPALIARSQAVSMKEMQP